MDTKDDRTVVKKQAPIIPTIGEAREDFADTIGRLLMAFGTATKEARDYVALKGEEDRSFFSHQVRYVAKVELKRDGIETQDCEIEDTANSGLCFVTPKYRVRVLKADGGDIPDPGASDRRKRFLNQQSEQLELFSTGETGQAAKADESEREPAHIIFLWEANARNFFTGLWFICPNGSSKPHFKLWIPAPAATDAKRDEGTPPPTPPPADDLGFTKKDDTSVQKIKTGTE